MVHFLLLAVVIAHALKTIIVDMIIVWGAGLLLALQVVSLGHSYVAPPTGHVLNSVGRLVKLLSLLGVRQGPQYAGLFVFNVNCLSLPMKRTKSSHPESFFAVFRWILAIIGGGVGLISIYKISPLLFVLFLMFVVLSLSCASIYVYLLKKKSSNQNQGLDSNMESHSIEKHLESLDIPVLRLETDYSQEDSGQIKTRVDAFVERLNQ